MKTPSNTPAFLPFFNHRLNVDPDTDFDGLRHCIDQSLERAMAIADLMEAALSANMANEVANLWQAARAIRFEILDAQEMLAVYVDVANVKPEASQADIEGGGQ